MNLRFLVAASALVLGSEALAQTPDYKVEARNILEHIVPFRTSRGHGEVPKMIDYLVKRLVAGGVPSDQIAILPAGETAGLLVRIAAPRASKRPVIFAAHMDVVDARPEDWKTDPFKLVEQNDAFFGRGVSDNKTGVTALVSTILRLKAEGFKPSRDLLFAFTGDEETDKKTTELIAKHPWARNAAFAINSDHGGGDIPASGKPTLYFMQAAEKTHINVELTSRNAGGHASRPRKDNAIYEIARALTKISDFHFPAMANDLTRAELKALAGDREGDAAAALHAFAANPLDKAAAERLTDDPEALALTRTTCVATIIDGGHITNALPELVKANLNCRIFPGDTVQNVRDTLVRVINDDKVSVAIVGSPTISPASIPIPEVTAAIDRALKKAGRNVAVVPSTSAGGSDGKVYRAAGIPTFGSAGWFIAGSMNQHGLDENVPEAAFFESIQHIYLLAKDLGA